MGQCASCGSTRQSIDSSSVPNSPSVEFTPADLFQNTACIEKFHPDFLLPDTKSEIRLSSALTLSQKNDDFELDRKLWVNTGKKSSNSKVSSKSSRKSRSSPRKKSKTVTFSEPIVRTFEPNGKLHIPFNKIRLTSKPRRSSINPNPDLYRCTKLIISTFEVNGKEVDGSEVREKEAGMGNNSSVSRPGVSRKYSCISNKAVRTSTFKTHSLEEPFIGSAVISPASISTSERSKSKSNQLASSTNFVTSQTESNLTKLNVLEASRKEKQLLRDRFFSSEGSSIHSPPHTLTPETDMNSNYSSSSKLNSPGFHQKGYIHQPEKVKRTFQYRSPSASAPVTPVDTNSNEIPKLYSPNICMVRTETCPIPTVNAKLNSAPPTVGTSKIPGFKSRTIISNKNVNPPRNSCASTPTQTFGPSTYCPDRRIGIMESFKKSATFDGNINRNSNGTDNRRESAPPKCLSQRKYTNSTSLTKVFPTKSPVGFQKMAIGSAEIKGNVEGRRYSLFSRNSTLTPENSGLKRPVESKPFYTIGLYQYKSPRPVSGEFPSVLQSQALNTGIVTQRKLFYQAQTEESGKTLLAHSTMTPKPTLPTPPSQFGLSRSATWVRGKNGEIKPDKEIIEPEDQLSHSASSSLKIVGNKSSKSETNLDKGGDTDLLNSNEREMVESLDFFKGEQKSAKSSCFPLEHTNSTTSTNSLLGTDGPCGDGNVISDSEFLIDDEISDQPELTLTFKDSPIRLSRSSSGESLLSCDLMLDLSLKDSVGPGEPEVTSDSAISDVSSSIPTSLGSQSVNSNGHINNSVLPRRTNRIASPFSSTTLSSKQNSKSAFGFRSTTGNQPQTKQIETQKSKTIFKIQERKSGLYLENKTSLQNSVIKSPSHGAKSYNRLSSTNRNISPRLSQSVNGSTEFQDEKLKRVEISSQIVINDLCRDVQFLREQLEVLKGVLVEQEIIQAGKDDTIQRLKKEIDILKRNTGKKKSHEHGEGDEIEVTDSGSVNKKYTTKYCGDEDENKMINSASQTDPTHRNRDLVHPPELNGRLVSFWIGRRSYSSYNSSLTFAT